MLYQLFVSERERLAFPSSRSPSLFPLLFDEDMVAVVVDH